MDAMSNCDSSEDTSSGHEDEDARGAHREGESSETNSHAPSESCGCEAASTSDRDEGEAATSDGSDWSNVSTSGRCGKPHNMRLPCACTRKPHNTQHATHALAYSRSALSAATSSVAPAVRKQLAADSSQLRGRQGEPLPRALAGAAQIASVHPLERSEMEVDADAGDSSGDITTTGKCVMK
jgi:hypothetical protein